MMKKGDILLHGHTHIPVCEPFGENTYINPGSVSIPKENSPHSYMIFENGEFLWKDLEQNTYKNFKIN
jgi:putative phosphoesterase